jgi:SH3 domain-containing protein
VAVVTCFVVAQSALVAGDGFVRVKASSANLRVAPNANSQVVVAVSSGAVFEIFSSSGPWVEVVGPSTASRYISASLVERVSGPPAFPDSEATLRSACREIVAAQDRADREAQQRYPDPDFKRQIDFQRVLCDRYEVPILARYGVAPAHTAHLTGICARNRWF